VREILVVANQTLGGDHLARVIRERISEGPTEFALLVPATQHTDFIVALAEAFAVQGGMHPPPPGDTADEGAKKRLDSGLAWMRELGATVVGTVGEHDPVRAIRDLLAEQAFDEIIVSTLPHGISSWLHQDLEHRLHRHTGLPVTVISAPHPTD
jgi:GABA permease